MSQSSIPESDHRGQQSAPVVSGHTPGPWVVNGKVREVGADGGEKHRLYCADIVLGAEWRGYVASVQSCDHIDGITREEAEANARLIAAAPDLVKALEEAIDVFEGMNDDEINVELLPRLRAALASAREVQP